MLYAFLVALCALILMLLLMPRLLPILKKMKFGQTIYELGPKHQQKQGTPNMGGLLIGGISAVLLIVCTVMLYAFETREFSKSRAVDFSFSQLFFSLDNRLFPLLLITLGSMAIGFADDYIKDVKKRHDGLSPKQKILMQLVLGAVFSTYCYFFVGHDILLPFTAKSWDLGWAYIPLMTLVVMFMTNSANLQDGLDGLLSTVTIVGMAAFGAVCMCLASVPGVDAMARVVLTTGCFALVGACAGFLRFNHYPAKIFMGDTGSMFIGGVMVGAAVVLKCEFLLLLICFTCVMSSVSVMLQTAYFKYTKKKTGTGKRIFKMSPIHHHFEMCGMKETQIVAMYAVVTLALAALAILSAVKWFA